VAKEHSLPQADSTQTPSEQVGPNHLSGPADARVRHVIEQIRPSIQADGGDVEFLELTNEGVVRIRLHGACVGCPSSSLTLQVGLERNLREHVPEVEAVEAVDE
jgi:Fe-S cluster biogenesis protein NfuA